MRSLVSFGLSLVAVSLCVGASRPTEIPPITVLTDARTFVDGFEITGIIERNRPGIALDHKRFVKVGQALDADGKTVLRAIDPTASGASKLTFERKSGERFSVIYPKPQSAK